MNGIYEGKKRFNCRQDAGVLLRVMSLIFSSARSKRWSRYVGTEPGSNSRHLAKEELRDSSDMFELNTLSWKTRRYTRGYRVLSENAREMCSRRNLRKRWSDHRSRVPLPSIELWFKFSRVAEVSRALFFNAKPPRLFPKRVGGGFHCGKVHRLPRIHTYESPRVKSLAESSYLTASGGLTTRRYMHFPRHHSKEKTFN